MLTPKLKQAGFGLTEVLISVVIISIGLLGLTSLQSHSIKSLQESDNLVTASMIAKEMAQRMLSNRYVLAQGRQGYLAVDLSGQIATAGGVPAWISSNPYPDAANCYTTNCFSPSDPSNHALALYNSQYMDQLELRGLAWNMLPQGQIQICFDSSSTATTTWTCNNTSTRTNVFGAAFENVFTVKVQWTNIFDNSTQMYAMQFSAECDNSDTNYCG